MCGIAGILQLDGQNVPHQRLKSMIAMVRHRGPDATETFVDHQTGLAHARLSIIDLTGGRQPMQTDDGQLAVTFNGEIYNYVELRELLVSRGHHFRTRSDTEVILHAYAEYGEECVDHFNGQWAFAIWDKRRRKLFLSRDRLGIRPLFYTQSSGRFLFASEIKSLFVNPEVPRQLDPHGMRQLFTFWSTLAPTTVFQGVHELPPGHNLVVSRGKLQTPYAYWQLDYAPAAEQRSTDDWTEELRWLLEDATRLRLRSDVPVGAYLSGGLDSSITTALAQRETGNRLRTFSVTFEDGAFDESGYQQETVDFLGVDHTTLRCSHGEIARLFPDVVWHAEKPVLRTAPAPLHLLAELVHDSGFKVVLTGEGADEMLGGYDIFKEAKVRRFHARDPESAMRAGLFSKLYPYLPKMQAQSNALRQAFFRGRPEAIASPLYSHLPRWEMTGQLQRFFSQDFLPQTEQREPFADVLATLPDAFSDWSPFCQAQYLETAILMPGYILSSQGDRATMAHSVESRFPFLDHRLVEFASKIPPRLKMKGLREKHLLKRATGDLVPPSVLERTKQPYRAPGATSFFSKDWKSTRTEYFDALLSRDRIQDDGLFQPDAVQRLLHKVRAGKATGVRDNMALVGILSTQLLVDQFIRNFPTEPMTTAAAAATGIRSTYPPKQHAPLSNGVLASSPTDQRSAVNAAHSCNTH